MVSHRRAHATQQCTEPEDHAHVSDQPCRRARCRPSLRMACSCPAAPLLPAACSSAGLQHRHCCTSTGSPSICITAAAASFPSPRLSSAATSMLHGTQLWMLASTPLCKRKAASKAPCVTSSCDRRAHAAMPAVQHTPWLLRGRLAQQQCCGPRLAPAHDPRPPAGHAHRLWTHARDSAAGGSWLQTQLSAGHPGC